MSHLEFLSHKDTSEQRLHFNNSSYFWIPRVVVMGVRRLFSKGGQNFPGGGAKTYYLPNIHLKRYYFPQKETKNILFWPAKEGARAPSCPPLRTPMVVVAHTVRLHFKYKKGRRAQNMGCTSVLINKNSFLLVNLSTMLNCDLQFILYWNNYLLIFFSIKAQLWNLHQ